MPASIIVTLTALSLIIALNFVLGMLALAHNPAEIVRVATAMVLGALLLLGMVLGHRLAWQWGRILGLLAAMFLTLGTVGFLLSFDGVPGPRWAKRLQAIILLIQTASLYIIFFALGRHSARHHFRLQCPMCHRFTNSAGDFFFTRAKCKYCDTIW
jgi:hypothetical protein